MTATREDEIEARLRAFLAEVHPAQAERTATMSNTESLWRVVDSMALLELVDWIEQLFAISVEPVEFVPEKFADLASLSRFVAQKIAGAATEPPESRAARDKRMRSGGRGRA